MGQRWGQHFLRSQKVIDAIVDSAQIDDNSHVLEIGPGEGVVTTGLCRLAGQVHVFEIDPKLAAGLRQRVLPNLTVHEGDFLQQSLAALSIPDVAWTVVANLPYYITAPILDRLLWDRPLPLRHAVLMMQEEVALRLCRPASREAGALTYIAGAFHQVEYLFKVSAACFAPPPKVESAVVKVTPRPEADLTPGLPRLYERLVSTAFGQRRKQLGRSLRSLSPQAADFLEAAGIEPSRRPETLTVEDFWNLARTWSPSV